MGLPSTAAEVRVMVRDYVDALEEERRKMDAFRRELPLSLGLVSQVIEKCKKETVEEVGGGGGGGGGPGGCGVRRADQVLLEEFLPLGPAVMSCDREVEQRAIGRAEEPERKTEWLKSVRLWSSNDDDGAVPSKEDGRAGKGGKSREGWRRQEQGRKQRRTWAPDLHRRFVEALRQLGGSHAATPKQIREIMKADGLSNDEVKSHLQKYRLHARRPSRRQAEDAPRRRGTPPQVVLGMWMPTADVTLGEHLQSLNSQSTATTSSF